jgi:hypothetical protein
MLAVYNIGISNKKGEKNGKNITRKQANTLGHR